MNFNIYIRESIQVSSGIKQVWDFTQNYNYRHKWDYSVLKACVKTVLPARVVKVVSPFNIFNAVFEYKVDKIPSKSSLVIKECNSLFADGGAGSWTYREVGKNTVWTQNNKIKLKENLFTKMFKPVIIFLFRILVKLSMKRAKKLIEFGHNLPSNFPVK